MNKYKVKFVKINKYVVDVLARNEKEAKKIAQNKFQEIQNKGLEYYHIIGDPKTKLDMIYDVTNTDDPFDPSII